MLTLPKRPRGQHCWSPSSTRNKHKHRKMHHGTPQRSVCAVEPEFRRGSPTDAGRCPNALCRSLGAFKSVQTSTRVPEKLNLNHLWRESRSRPARPCPGAGNTIVAGIWHARARPRTRTRQPCAGPAPRGPCTTLCAETKPEGPVPVCASGR
jgi:hypothetical protein